MNVNDRLAKFSKSKFRSKFHLSKEDKKYIKEKGISTIREHAKSIITNRLRIKLVNDGKQTPYKGHPVFTAQHATALCCRKCIFKWYNVEQDLILNDKLIEYFTDIIMKWIENEI